MAVDKEAEAAFIKKVSASGAFKLYNLKELPMAYLSGLKIKELDTEKCEISIPYKWLNKNPFQSIYFACLSMAAEMSTGLMAMAKVQGIEPGVALLVVGMEAMFIKKATGLITFVCEEGAELDKTIAEVVETKEARMLELNSIGRNEAGEQVARFVITWSFKQRQQ